MFYFHFSCPLIPLLPDGQGYPPSYQLPKRQRNEDALNLPQLIEIFRKSIIYESIEEKKNDFGVLNVLSPYSLLCHVMVMELSPNRFLPGPESFEINEWRKLSEISYKVIQKMNLVTNSKNDQISTFCGFNWSPYSWGFYEEKGGCQSITTKFHMMIWQWPKISKIEMNEKSNLPEKHQQIFFGNDYNEPFGKLVGQILDFPSYEVSPRGIFIPIEKIDIELLFKLKEISEKVEKIIENLNKILVKNFDVAFNEVKKAMEESSMRVISEDEVNTKLRYNHIELNSLQSCLSYCKCDEEKQIISSIYQSVVERVKMNSLPSSDFEKIKDKEIWEKFFGFSLVLKESLNSNDIKNGLYIGLHPLCGPGGCAEVLGCYLTRPEQRMADEEVMIAHNHQIWQLKEELNK